MRYILREQVQSLMAEFAKALHQSDLHPVVFYIWGNHGVGKTTLLEYLEIKYENQANFVMLSLGNDQDVATPLRIMDNIIHELFKQLSNINISAVNYFAILYTRYQQTLQELNLSQLNSKDLLNFSLGLGSSVSRDYWQKILQQHPVTKQKSELQELLIQPLEKLTQAFTETLVQIGKLPIVIVFDNYEKVTEETNVWFWNYLVSNAELRSHKIFFILAGTNSLDIDKQKSPLVYAHHLEELNKEEVRTYLQEINVSLPTEIRQIYKLSKGLPYYLNCLVRQRKENGEIDFAYPYQTIIELLLVNLPMHHKQLLYLLACCRWFNRSILRDFSEKSQLNLLSLPEEEFRYFNWLKQCHFVELKQGRYYLNEIFRNELRLLLWQEDPDEFYRVNTILASYFRKLADAEILPEMPMASQYENSQWCVYTTEYLYYNLFSRSPEYQINLISIIFESQFFGKTCVVQEALNAIAWETKLTEHPLLSYGVKKFIAAIQPVLKYGWMLLESDVIDFAYLQEKGIQIAEIEVALKLCFQQIPVLDGLAKFAAIFYKIKRCIPQERKDWLQLLFVQAEKITDSLEPEFSKDLLFKLSNLADELGYYEIAIASYDRVLKYTPNSSKAWYKRGVAMRKKGIFPEAILSFNKALELQNNDADIYYEKGIALRKLKYYAEAIANYRQALELQPEKHEAWNNCGIALRKLGRLEEAISSYNQALEIQPNDPVIWYNKGISLDEIGDWNMAVASYDKALELQPNDYEAWYNRGIALRKLGQLEMALSSYEKALELNLEDAASWYNRGYVLDELGRFAEAIASYDKALELEPEDSSTWYNRGLALRQLGSFSEAIASYDKALELQPDKYQAWHNRGQVLRQLGRFQEAIANYDVAIELKPDYAIAWYNKACCYALLGNTNLALLNLEQTVQLNAVEYLPKAKIDPDFDDIRANQQFQNLLIAYS
ncbi:tetratricopeptide repeat protein [Phormidium sp. LEGE 05292]|uniref:tetratricopeptide repeat protein n=1 Tax=[Phormidium] sp. LEGE 05292 TaxID=767427 RepID=UPI00187DFF42|nr:tetratricopeptide repeat protein [Phormidium sp. LEGE 05292]MBE9228743.1 tetratricopeptide repeat protein [Phormidium sp. LEGE 05292]